MSINITHSLGQDEAKKRLIAQIELYRNQVDDLHEQWSGYTLTFDCKTQAVEVPIIGTIGAGNGIHGTVIVEDAIGRGHTLFALEVQDFNAGDQRVCQAGTGTTSCRWPVSCGRLPTTAVEAAR